MARCGGVALHPTFGYPRIWYLKSRSVGLPPLQKSCLGNVKLRARAFENYNYDTKRIEVSVGLVCATNWQTVNPSTAFKLHHLHVQPSNYVFFRSTAVRPAHATIT